MIEKKSLFVIDSSVLIAIIAPAIKQFVNLTKITNFTTTSVMCWCVANTLEKNYYTTVKNHYKNSYPESIIYYAVQIEIENYLFHALPFVAFNKLNNAVVTIRPRGQNLFILAEQ